MKPKFNFRDDSPEGVPWQKRVQKPEGELSELISRIVRLDCGIRGQAMEMAMIFEEIEYSKMYQRQGLSSMSHWIWWMKAYHDLEPGESLIATYCEGVRLWIRKLHFDPGTLAAHFHIHSLGQLAAVIKDRISTRKAAKAKLDELLAEGITNMLRKYAPHAVTPIKSPNRPTWVDSMHNSEKMYRETLAETADFLETQGSAISLNGRYSQVRLHLENRARHIRGLLEGNHGETPADEMRAHG